MKILSAVFSAIFILCGLLHTPLLAQDYGEIYLEDTSRRDLSNYTFHVGYSLDLSDSFSDMHSLTLKGQRKIWRYISTGLLYQKSFPRVSQAGKQLEALEPTVNVTIPQFLWGLYSLTEVQLIVGEWNMFNTFDLGVELMVGAGGGLSHDRPDTQRSGSYSASYLWSIEQRTRILKNAGLFVSVIGHRGGVFGGSGLVVNF
jgi:hypothetical protein